MGDKSCDIKAEDNGLEIYYESKDASYQILSRYTYRNNLYSDQMSPSQIESWVWKKIKEADKKGADYLICKVPVWIGITEKHEPATYDKWAKAIFKNIDQIGPAHFRIAISNVRPLKNLKGFYILKLTDAIKIELLK